MKRNLSIFLILLLVCSLLAIPAAAEENQSPENSTTGTSAENPGGTADGTESQPTVTAPPDNTTETVQPSTPCTHSYGEWDADESGHWRSCTLCGYRDSAGHSWAAETIRVEPTCGEVGGVCKICTVCGGVLVTEIIPQTQAHTYDNACDAECNVCGAEREVTHSFGTAWSKNYKGHWHVCTICGAEGELKAHYPGPAATEEKDQICLTCGYIMTKKLQHTHKYAAEWSSDSTGHWHVCTVCQEKDQFASHTYDDACDADCNDCGYLRKPVHSYGELQSDENGHWQVCSLCGAEGPREEHDRNPEGVCAICQYALAESHAHEYSQVWKFDETHHWQECDCGERAEEGAHIWDEGREEDGMIRFTCEVCQAEKQEEAPETGFPWLLLLAGCGIVLCAAGIVICIVIGGKKGTFAQ